MICGLKIRVHGDEEMKVRDICAGIADGSHNPPQGIEISDYLMLSSKNIFDDEITFDDPRYLTQADFEQEDRRTKVKEGDVLLTIVGTVGRTAVVDKKMPRFTLQRSVAVLKPKADICSSRYLMYALQGERTHIENSAKGVAQKGIYLNEVSNIDLRIPALSEQESIVIRLDKIVSIIHFYQQQLQKLDELVKSRFVEMFGGIHDSALYPYMTVDSFTKVTSGGTPDRNTPSYWENGKIRWVKTTELQNCVICDTEERITDDGVENSSAKMVPANTILVAMYGQGKTRGMTGYLAVECTTNQACACILPSEGINQKYLWQYMMLSYDKLRGMAKGGNQPNLNAGLIKSFPVLLPPLELQNRFAAFVAEVDKSKLSYEMEVAA